MVDRHDNPHGRGAVRRAPPAMSERQLEAYFLARDTVRRLRDAAMRATPPPTRAADRSC